MKKNSEIQTPNVLKYLGSLTAHKDFFLVIKLKNKTEKSDKMPKSGTHVYNSKTYPADCWKIGDETGASIDTNKH